MPIRKTLVQSKAGVRLERVETLSAQGKLQSQHYVLKTYRPNQPRVLAEERAALDAFDLEVIASLADPIACRMAGED
ncbi:hypothetical protein [Brevundimonas sp. Root1423]|uniref:hypothetical protein n=1 Tax=Brevundimonas sp. Root1423 TaxID=1736462 RepID=UPI0006FDE52F|nr:hypothetical protein [Brevundimonas sp. Root1423]KQY96394.1 hypothetical protein ASD25_00450 [Brevundimonas sp. Root1423]